MYCVSTARHQPARQETRTGIPSRSTNLSPRNSCRQHRGGKPHASALLPPRLCHLHHYLSAVAAANRSRPARRLGPCLVSLSHLRVLGRVQVGSVRLEGLELALSLSFVISNDSSRTNSGGGRDPPAPIGQNRKTAVTNTTGNIGYNIYLICASSWGKEHTEQRS